MTIILGIDYGTTASLGVLSIDGDVSLLAVGGNQSLVPSTIVRGDDGQLVAGFAAARSVARDPSRAERTPKRLIGRQREITLAGGPPVPIDRAVAATISLINKEALRQLDQRPPDKVVMTHPAAWQDTRTSVLREAAALAGLPEIDLVPEPVAAARYLVSRAPAQYRKIAVFDLGGGTLDTAVLRQIEDGWEVLGVPGGDQEFGGEHLDDRLFDWVLEQVPDTARFSLDDVASARRASTLRERVREAKEALSDYPSHKLIPSDDDRAVTLERSTFEQLIEDLVQRASAMLMDTIQSAGTNADDLDAVVLTGGASRTPIVEQQLRELFGDRLRTWGDPKAVVAQGATLAPSVPSPQVAQMPPPDRAPVAPVVSPPRPPGGPEPMVSAPMTPHRTPGAGPTPAAASRKSGSRRGVLVGAGAAAVLALAGIAIANSGGEDDSPDFVSRSPTVVEPVSPPVDPEPETEEPEPPPVDPEPETEEPDPARIVEIFDSSGLISMEVPGYWDYDESTFFFGDLPSLARANVSAAMPGFAGGWGSSGVAILLLPPGEPPGTSPDVLADELAIAASGGSCSYIDSGSTATEGYVAYEACGGTDTVLEAYVGFLRHDDGAFYLYMILAQYADDGERPYVGDIVESIRFDV